MKFVVLLLVLLGVGYFPGTLEAAPEIVLPHKAESYYVYDLKDNRVLFEKNSLVVRPIASLTKLMTAVVAKEFIPENGVIYVSPNAFKTLGAWAGIREGERFTRNDALRPLLLNSDNDIAVAFTEYPMTPNFITHMNSKAREIGMYSTTFVEGSGLDSRNVSTVRDYAKLLAYVRINHPDLFNISREATYSTKSISGHPYTFKNNSGLINHPERVGGKSGYISASGRTMGSVFSVKDSAGNTRDIAVVTFKSLSQEEGEDSRALVEYTRTRLNLEEKLRVLIAQYNDLLLALKKQQSLTQSNAL